MNAGDDRWKRLGRVIWAHVKDILTEFMLVFRSQAIGMAAQALLVLLAAWLRWWFGRGGFGPA